MNFNTELLFHTTLQKNQKAIKELNIHSLLNIENRSFNEFTETDKGKKMIFLKRIFANILLAFFQKYSLNNERFSDGIVEISINSLFSNPQFILMIDGFCKENLIDDKRKFFKECIEKLDQHALGKVVNEDTIEIKVEDIRFKNEILELLRSSEKGVTFIEIFENISNAFDNFYTNDFVKFYLQNLLDKGYILQIAQNTYQII